MFQMHSELRSVTAICVVEDVSKCPLGYTPIVRTQDTEMDADLWKDGLFARRVTRYVCLSKSQGKPEHVIQDVQILSEKELPPEGFSVIQQTTDTSQKAFQKKQLCYKYTHYKQNVESIADVIVRSKTKNPPDGYEHIGDINGMQFFVRKVSALTRLSNPTGGPFGNPYSSPFGGVGYPNLQDSMGNLNIANGNGSAHRSSLPNSTGPLVNQPMFPSPAQYSTSPKTNYSTATLSHLTGIEGVPFVLREDLRPVSENGLSSRGSAWGQGQAKFPIPVKTQTDIERDYDYDFRAEREALYGIM